MTAPDPTAAFRDQLWQTIADGRGYRRHPGDASTDDIVDALEPVIRQIVATELRDFANLMCAGRNRPIAELLRARAADLSGGAR